MTAKIYLADYDNMPKGAMLTAHFAMQPLVNNRYVFAGEVVADSAERAFVLSQNQDASPWQADAPKRSTMPGDVIVIDNLAYWIFPVGFSKPIRVEPELKDGYFVIDNRRIEDVVATTESFSREYDAMVRKELGVPPTVTAANRLIAAATSKGRLDTNMRQLVLFLLAEVYEQQQYRQQLLNKIDEACRQESGEDYPNLPMALIELLDQHRAGLI